MMPTDDHLISRLFWLALALKMAVHAGFVVAASMVTERAGPFIGALVADAADRGRPGLRLPGARSRLRNSSRQSALGEPRRPMRRPAYFALVYALLAQRRVAGRQPGGALPVWLRSARSAMRSVRLDARRRRSLLNVVGLRDRHAAGASAIRAVADAADRCAAGTTSRCAPLLVAALVGAVVTTVEPPRRPDAHRHARGVPDRAVEPRSLILHPRIGGPAPPALHRQRHARA